MLAVFTIDLETRACVVRLIFLLKIRARKKYVLESTTVVVFDEEG